MKLFQRKYLLITGIVLLGVIKSQAQTTISGTIMDSKKHPISNASIIIKESNKGVDADSVGRFLLQAQNKGKITLQVSAIGYMTKEIELNERDSSVHLEIMLKEERMMLGQVVVGAGSFEASDKAKGASLTPMDAVTVAGNGGDLANAMRSLPGSQQIGEKEGLFVRGGTGSETKQFVDGALLPNPNYVSVPGLPQPAHLNPFLFKGILFSSGGYSVLYGDALSSALILETVDLPDKSSASLHIFPSSQGLGFQELAHNNKSSYGVNVSYGNLQLYNKVVPQKPDYFHAPEYFSADGNFRIKTGKTGLLKFYTNYGFNHVGMRNADIDSNNLLSSFQVKGLNVYSNLSYHQLLGHHWKIDAVVAYNYNGQNTATALLDDQHQQIRIADTPYNAKNSSIDIHSNLNQLRTVLTRTFAHRQALRFGAEYFSGQDEYRFDTGKTILNDHLIAAFAEADIYITQNIAAKAGLRFEHSSLLNKTAVSPRLSMAYRFYDGGQINLAYGVFYEKPETVYLLPYPDADFEKATHYIINYQKKENNRLFRIEAYYKQYEHLITTQPVMGNAGGGYAKGIELFFRDKKTFKNFDYWITYTYLDTKRRFLNYPEELHPDFATPHTASVAIKRFFPDINLSANLSYSLATGRPYYDIKTPADGKTFICDRGTTNMYNCMSLSFAYLFNMFKSRKLKDFSGIGFGINNVFGTKQVFGYNYSFNGNNKAPIMPPAARNYYIGIFISLGIDRRDDFINDNL